ncbi:hypothetical protein NQ314_020255 [Rhamnusium bicolor]|uniref:DDE-1 domain-containing protein n=1 Tax=Rhamnusium bicolor TaxID=1586634 RepID=A0AAV8WM73_9CUCU|nr:hypothetical protein NQ314_020255 [Rhamnusium bicolor]
MTALHLFSLVKKVFNETEESELVNYIKMAAKMHYGLNLANVKKLAYEYAITNKKNIHPNGTRKRKQEIIGLGVSGTDILHHFHLESLRSALAKGKFEPSRIYNIDEMGITTVQQPPKILAPKGVKQIGGMTSAERGVLVTMICCINAAGNTVPPLFVFPRANFKNHMLKGAPVGAIGAANKSGWSNEDVFFKYLQHFISHVKPTIEDKVILLLDNHESHVSIPTIELAKRSGVILVIFHPHTSHRMQPLDVCVYEPFKTYYSSAQTQLTSRRLRQAITKGFQVSGLYPLKSDIFGEQDFLPSNVTDRTDPNLSKASSQIKPLSSNETSVITAAVSPQTMSPSLNVSLSELENQPSSSDITVPPRSSDNSMTKAENTPSTSTGGLTSQNRVCIISNIILPHEIRPIPKAPPRKGTASRGQEDNENEWEVDDDSDNDSSLADLEIDPTSFSLENIQQGDFILVQLKGKKHSANFVATVISRVDNNDLIIKYLKKKVSFAHGYTFVIEDETEYTAHINDIVMKLLQPSTAGSSNRQSNTYVFPVSFNTINLS